MQRIQARSRKLAKDAVRKILLQFPDCENFKKSLIKDMEVQIQKNVTLNRLFKVSNTLLKKPAKMVDTLMTHLNLGDNSDVKELLSQFGTQYIIDALSNTVEELNLNKLIAVPIQPGSDLLQGRGLFANNKNHLSPVNQPLHDGNNNALPSEQGGRGEGEIDKHINKETSFFN